MANCYRVGHFLQGIRAISESSGGDPRRLEAMEFCSRLSQRTGRKYTLPSEAQWE